jgi:hypothetical protein
MSRHISVHRGNYYNMIDNKVITNTTSNIIQLCINYNRDRLQLQIFTIVSEVIILVITTNM